MQEEAGKEIKLNNGAILFLIPRKDQYGGEEMVPKEFIIRKRTPDTNEVKKIITDLTMVQ